MRFGLHIAPTNANGCPKAIANTVVGSLDEIIGSLDEIKEVLTTALQRYRDNPALLTRLTAFPWIRKASKYN
jgi:hypothetical protein